MRMPTYSEARGRQGTETMNPFDQKKGVVTTSLKNKTGPVSNQFPRSMFSMGSDSYFESMKMRLGRRFPGRSRIVFEFPCEDRLFAKNCKDRGFFLAPERS